MSSGDWDLFAVVRSCSSSAPTATINTTNSCSSDGGEGKQDLLPLFKHIHGKESSSCKPFLPLTWSPPSLLAPPVVSSAPNVHMKQEQGLLESQDQNPPIGVRVFPASTTISSSSSPVFIFRSQRDHLLQQQSQAPLRSRKRKNQQKKTICHVTQENLSSDMWAWRKYGQKPIKGSPYPRNYYRCTSLKGCLARKQVERSNLDPNIFIVTYTGEHTHPRPAYRNSLAGSTRNKSQPLNPISKPGPLGQPVPRSETVKEEIHLSSTTLLKENDDVQETNVEEDRNSQEVNMEDEDVDEEVEDDDDVDNLLIPNFAVRDREELFFAGNLSPWSAGDVKG